MESRFAHRRAAGAVDRPPLFDADAQAEQMRRDIRAWGADLAAGRSDVVIARPAPAPGSLAAVEAEQSRRAAELLDAHARAADESDLIADLSPLRQR